MQQHGTGLAPFYKGWDEYQGLLVRAVAPLSPEQLALRLTPSLRSIENLAAHIVGARALVPRHARRGRPSVRRHSVLGPGGRVAAHGRRTGWRAGNDLGINQGVARALDTDHARRPVHVATGPPSHPAVGHLARHRARPAPRGRTLFHPGGTRPAHAGSVATRGGGGGGGGKAGRRVGGGQAAPSHPHAAFAASAASAASLVRRSRRGG